MRPLVLFLVLLGCGRTGVGFDGFDGFDGGVNDAGLPVVLKPMGRTVAWDLGGTCAPQRPLTFVPLTGPFELRATVAGALDQGVFAGAISAPTTFIAQRAGATEGGGGSFSFGSLGLAPQAQVNVTLRPFSAVPNGPAVAVTADVMAFAGDVVDSTTCAVQLTVRDDAAGLGVRARPVRESQALLPFEGLRLQVGEPVRREQLLGLGLQQDGAPVAFELGSVTRAELQGFGAVFAATPKSFLTPGARVRLTGAGTDAVGHPLTVDAAPAAQVVPLDGFADDNPGFERGLQGWAFDRFVRAPTVVAQLGELAALSGTQSLLVEEGRLAFARFKVPAGAKVLTLKVLGLSADERPASLGFAAKATLKLYRSPGDGVTLFDLDEEEANLQPCKAGAYKRCSSLRKLVAPLEVPANETLYLKAEVGPASFFYPPRRALVVDAISFE